MKKVFISSTMRDLGAERQAAKTAVEALRQKPVMAEDFGAKPYSSQMACLEGVRQSDVFIAVLGFQYGFVSKAGVSVSEEEFNEARRRGLPILVFVMEGDLEPQQKEFFGRIGKYEEGYFVDFFETAHALQTKVTRALYDLIGQPEVTTLTANTAARHLAKYVGRLSNVTPHIPLLGAVMFPARQGEEYLSLLDMARMEIKEKLMQSALFGKGAILRPSAATEAIDGEGHLGFMQKGPHGQLASSVEFFPDGTLVWSSLLEPEDHRDFRGLDLVKQYVIDQDDVERRLATFAAFAGGYYDGLEAAPTLSSFFATVVLRNVNGKWFGHHPKNPTSSMSMPMDDMGDPMLVPPEPLKVARAELGEPRKLAAKLVALTERTFKARNRLYGQ